MSASTDGAYSVYGYYDSPTQPADQPSINPDPRGPCLFCGDAMTADNVRTISMMTLPDVGRAERAYFYRVHRTCHQDATDQSRQQIDEVVWAAIKHHGD